MDAVLLARLGGIAHLVSLAAILYAPRALHWDSELARIPRLLRQMCGAYQAYTSGTIVAMGLVSLLCARDLASGTPLARAVSGYIALFWLARLALQALYDFRPYLTTPWLRLGYHALTPLFIGFVAFYGCLAFR